MNEHNNCLICHGDKQKGLSFFQYWKKEDTVCGKCRERFSICDRHVNIQGLPIYALYYYDDFFENIMFTLKEGKDIALASIFLFPFIAKIHRKFHNHIIVYAPSSDKKTQERGFLPLEVLFQDIKLEKVSMFYKTKDYKQSSQQYKYRENVKHVLQMKDIEIPKKQIVLVDDVCTSGATLRYLYQQLTAKGYRVRILTIGINKKLLD